MIRLRLLPLLAVAVFSCGPNADSPRDAGPADASPVATDRTLAFGGTDSLQLEPGAHAPIVVRLRDARTGALLEGEQVRLALVRGDARDATLADTMLTTGTGADAGIVRTTLTASSDTATFWVRASANRATDAYLFVAVSARGFGGLSVMAAYEGRRMPQSLLLDLFGNRDCAHLADAEPIRSVPLPASGGIAAVSGLPAGETFAVRGHALGSGGVVLAASCIDRLVVARDESVSGTMAFTDRNLTLEGEYDITFQLDLGAAPAVVSGQWLQAIAGEIDTHGDETGYLLDAIATAVGAPATPARDSFDAARDSLRATLSTLYGVRGSTPTLALTDLAGNISLAAESVSLRARATMLTDGSFSLSNGYLGIDPLTPDVSTDDTHTPIDVGGTGRVATSTQDRAAGSISQLTIAMPAIASAARSALLARLGAASTADWVNVNARCVEVATVLVPSTGSACGAACVEAACRGAVTRLASVFDNAVEHSGSDYRGIDARFEGPVTGVGATLRIEVLDNAALAGAFSNQPAFGVLGSVRMALRPAQ